MADKVSPGKPDAEMANEERKPSDDAPYAQDEESVPQDGQIDTNAQKAIQKKKRVVRNADESEEEAEAEASDNSEHVAKKEKKEAKSRVNLVKRQARQFNVETENFFTARITDVPQFKVCLESVKFPKTSSQKNQFNVSILISFL